MWPHILRKTQMTQTLQNDNIIKSLDRDLFVRNRRDYDKYFDSVLSAQPHWFYWKIVYDATSLHIYKRFSAVSYYIYAIYSISINPCFACILFLFSVVGNRILEFPPREQYGQRLQLPIYYILALSIAWIHWMQPLELYLMLSNFGDLAKRQI